ncbi:MAG: cytochrome c [Gammaproteobacteria bacterium]|nr:MAG: cytochrome c [Gammaproteobacteria bacterium]RLA51784.1 MAG: cytochrome c [Gammaproteobacteria bacterium]
MRILNAMIVAASLTIAASPALAGDADAGKTTFDTKGCAGCHGAGGAAPTEGNPKLAGNDAATIKKALTDFKSGARSNPVMNGMAAMLNDAEIDNVAAYIGAQ